VRGEKTNRINKNSPKKSFLTLKNLNRFKCKQLITSYLIKNNISILLSGNYAYFKSKTLLIIVI
jgi:hypothetical protein